MEVGSFIAECGGRELYRRSVEVGSFIDGVWRSGAL